MTNGTSFNDNNTTQNGVYYPALYGTPFDDSISGLAGNDILSAGSGNDYLDGGSGADTMYGGADGDTYIVDDVGDLVVEYANDGLDQVYSSIASYTLPANVETLYLTGTGNSSGIGNALDNFILGNSGNNNILGGAGNDQLYGGDGNDALYGGTGSDFLSGGNGSDRLIGAFQELDSLVIDTLVGGAASDTFVLGGGWGVSYTSIEGKNEGGGYAIIQDWNPAADYIEAKGNANQYSIEYSYGSFSSVAGTSATDAFIYYTGNNGSDLIAVIQDSVDVNFARDFKFI
ncbi:calcium-binding protein [Scytonema sp. NUACC26]|uniref:calcium-binding protein n=1 Tax=Scytonema sp. NUACC26 TaxID=3140176 RepID=UPI0034DC5946